MCTVRRWAAGTVDRRHWTAALPRGRVAGVTRALYETLWRITTRPEPFSVSSVATLWTDPHLSGMMLRAHLDDDVEGASRTSAFVDTSVAWLVERFTVGPGTVVLDLGCGPGHYTTRLARTGAEVTGIDLSQRSLDHARRVAADEDLDVTYVQGDYLAFRPERRFDLVTMIMLDVAVLGPADRHRLFDGVAGALAPDGAFVFDVPSLNALAAVEEGHTLTRSPEGGFWSPDPYLLVTTTFRYDEERVSLDRYDVVEPEGDRTVFTWLQHFDPPSLTHELEAAGLAVEEVLGDVAGRPYAPDAPAFCVVATTP